VSASARSSACSSETRVLEAQRELRGALAGRDQPLEPAEQRLEVDVPDPRDVAAVCDLVVERDQQQRGRARRHERADDLVRAGRVLDQQNEQRTVADRDPLEPPECGRRALQTGLDLVE
jgi:hypothetical protein